MKKGNVVEESSIDLYYEEYGQGRPVIFLHGFPFDHTIWQPLVPLLEQDARLILPDLRGFGKSPVPEGVYTMREMAEDVVRLMDHLEIGKAVVVGHSMGGYVSLAFAHAYPNRLCGLALVATQAAADNPEKRQSRLRQASSAQRRGPRVVVKAMAPHMTPHTELVQPLVELMMSTDSKGIVGALRGMAHRQDMTGELSRMNIPAVVVAGEADQLLSMGNMETMAQMLPKSWMVTIPGGGHMLMMEAPEQVADALRQLIQMAGE